MKTQEISAPSTNDKRAMNSKNDTPKPNPLDTTNILFKLTLEWMTTFIFRGAWRTLEMEDLWDLRKSHSAKELGKRFTEEFEKRKKSKHSLLLTMNKMVGLQFFFAGVLKIIGDVFNLIGPMFLKLLLDFLQSKPPNEPPAYMGYVWAACLALCQFIAVVFINASHYNTQLVGLKIRSALSTMIYNKGLVLSNKAKQIKSNGEILNLMSLDAQLIAGVCQFFHIGWSAVVQVAIGLGFLFYLLGWVTFVGIGTMIVLSPIQSIVIGLFSKFRERILALSDQRMKIITEVLQGISTIKFFNWESNYMMEVFRIRRKEIFKVFQSTFLASLMGVCFSSFPIVVSIVTYIVYVAVGNELTASIIFGSIAYFNAIRLPLMLFLMSIQLTTEAAVSINRVQTFLLMDENEPLNFGQLTDTPIKLEDCTFEWDQKPEKKPKQNNKKSWGFSKKKKQSTENTDSIKVDLDEKSVTKEMKDIKPKVGRLENINLEIKKGELVCIVGKVGSGKTSLLSGIIGEMKKVSGKVTVNGKLAYCPQQAWIQNASLRDNITFGNPFDKTKYDHVIDICSLRKDIEILQAGDLTEIGEKGINLSGGQRQRVSIARAVYANKDIYIFDDPLSAVDANVGRHIFEQCILDHLKDKTRILVTHQLQYLKFASRILVLDDGKLIEQGTFEELSNKKDGHLKRLLDEYSVKEHDQQKTASKKKQTTTTTQQDDAEMEKFAKLMQEEERAKGFISMKVIWTYIQSGGGIIIVLLVGLFFAINQLALASSEIWMSFWVDMRFPVLNNWIFPWSYIIIYSGIGVVASVITFFRSLVMFLFAMSAANNLFKKSFKRVIRSPKVFFDTTPIGRILSRFSKDQDVLDSLLISTLSQSLEMAAGIISIFIIIGATNYWMLIPIFPIFFALVIVQQLFARSSREVKRLESLTRSPLYSHFAESLTGISTIRAYKMEEQFKLINQQNVDKNLRCWFAHDMAQRWLGIRLETICAVLVTVTSMVIVATRGLVEPGLAGLALTNSIALSGFVSWAVIQFTETEIQMNSVERVVHYTGLEVEPTEIKKPECEPEPSWPQKGEIVFENFKLRYRPGLELVLNGINLHIKPNEKIGIVGRTGAGKSTLMLALYRLIEPAEGSILIDGKNIHKLNLSTLRRRLSIIPQEPVLFTGTVRSNIDPFKEYSDQHLWDALERAHMKKKIEKLDKKLDAPVAPGGENFSVGERQLLCLARALCRKTKILLIDECTANVDLETDFLIQKTIDQEFSDCTRLTIAHRLNTVINSDRILVLDKGLVAEFDTPKNLLSNPKGIFTELVNQTGTENAKLLFQTVFGDKKADDSMKEKKLLQEKDTSMENQTEN